MSTGKRYYYGWPLKCDTCGRFMSGTKQGESWSQNWGYSMSGEPELYDPTHRCATCTEARGVKATNCCEERGLKYAGVNT